MTRVNTDMERLETILRELKEPIVVCDSNATILLYNAAAKRLFRNNQALGLGQSLYKVCTRSPVEHTLRMLKHRSTNKDRYDPKDTDVRFSCATTDGKILLDCNITQIAYPSDQRFVFIFTFEDMTRQVNEMARQGYLLEKMIKDLRAPITNLNTAVESLKSYPDMNTDVRSSLEDIVFRESEDLKQRFESVVEESAKITNVQWPLFDVYSSDLIECVSSRLKEEDDIIVTMTGVPLWLHADSYSLMFVLCHLVRFVRYTCEVTEVDIEVLLGDRRVYIDIIWQGDPISQSAIDPILAQTLPETVEGMTVGDILAHHNSEIWSQRHRRENYSLLRIPVPDSPRQWEVPPEPLPERLEFYDFTLVESSDELGEMADRPLSSFNYVVFDTETTGLRPSDGDEILSIAAVRIVNRRILSGERFERLIKPQKPIPESSLPFLEITQEMVQEESPAEVVLPQFRSFVSDAVMVGHNPTIDMHFLRLQEERSGVKFENPILDTLLMALLIDKGRTNYTLQDISRWLGIEIRGSQMIMDDCFVTAQIFLKLLDLVEEKGIITLGELVDASRLVSEEKRQQAG